MKTAVLVGLAIAVLAVSANAKPVRPADVPKAPKELLQKRVEAAQRVFEQQFKRAKGGTVSSAADVCVWSERWLNAELALCENRQERIKALEEHLKRVRAAEALAETFVRAGQAARADLDAVTYFRLDAEIRLHEEGVDPSAAPPAKK